MKKFLFLSIIIVIVSGCATQRYGRQTRVTEVEKSMLDCKQIKIEIAKAEEFVRDVEMQRANISGAHVLGFMADFGLGNNVEGDAAESSGKQRLYDLKSLEAQKCNN